MRRITDVSTLRIGQNVRAKYSSPAFEFDGVVTVKQYYGCNRTVSLDGWNLQLGTSGLKLFELDSNNEDNEDDTAQSEPSSKIQVKGSGMAKFESGQYVLASFSGDWGGLESAGVIIVRLDNDDDGDIVIEGTSLVVGEDGDSNCEIKITPLTPCLIREICSDNDETDEADETDETDDGEIKDETTQSELKEKVQSLEKSLAAAKDALAWMVTTKAKNYDSVEHGVYRAITAMQHSEDKIEASKRISDILKSSIKKQKRAR